MAALRAQPYVTHGLSDQNFVIDRRDEVLIHPSEQLRLGELQMISLRGVKEKLACLVHGREPEKILLVPTGLIHSQQSLEIRVVATPMLALMWVDHRIPFGLDHNEAIGFDEVLLDCMVNSVAFIVPLCKLRMGFVCCAIYRFRVTIIIRLEEVILNEWGVCTRANDKVRKKPARRPQ